MEDALQIFGEEISVNPHMSQAVLEELTLRKAMESVPPSLKLEVHRKMARATCLNFMEKLTAIADLVESTIPKREPTLPIRQVPLPSQGPLPSQSLHKKTPSAMQILKDDYHRAIQNGAVFEQLPPSDGIMYNRRGDYYLPRSRPLNFPVLNNGRFSAAALIHFAQACAKCGEPSHLIGHPNCAYARDPLLTQNCQRCNRGLHREDHCLAFI